MHEMALMHEVVNLVVQQAEAIGAPVVTEVHLTVGEGRDVVEDYMGGLFSFLTKGTVAEDAELVVHRVPFTAQCKQCGTAFTINMYDQKTQVCPHCHAVRNYQIKSGLEFMITHIQVSDQAPLRNAS